jgi:predicted permease
MGWLTGVLARLRETLDRSRYENELDEEIRLHIERETERLMRSGMDPASACRQAERTFGGVDHVKESSREGAGLPWIETALRDARHAGRGLRRNPGFAVATVLTLGLGIGATTAIFSVVDGVLLEPLPYPGADRLVRIVQQNSPENRWNISMADFLAIQEQQETFVSVAAYSRVPGNAAFTGRGDPERIEVARVSADWFEVLGVEPAEGRAFGEAEDDPGAETVVVLSAAFRDRVFGPDADALGATVTVDDVPHVVVGVLGPEHASLAGLTPDVWPILSLETPDRRGPFLYGGIGRLQADRTLEEARADLDAISRRIFGIWSGTGFGDAQARLTPYPLKEIMVGDVGRGLWLMLGAVIGVLLIAVANVGNLFLVRAAGREQEMRLRASLGASRARLAGQLLVESLVVAGLGGAVGVALARVGLEALVAGGPALPRMAEVGLDGSVLFATAAITLMAALVFGMAPLARLVLARLEAPGGSRGNGGAGGWSRVRGALVTAEFAMAFGLSTGAALLVGSFVHLQQVDPGYDPTNVVAMRVGLPEQRYPDYTAAQAFWTDLLRGLDETSVLEAAGVGAALPPAGSAGTNDFDLLDDPVAPGESSPVALWNWVSPGFFESLGVPLLRGRMFDEGDRTTDGEPVIVVSESWARAYYRDGEVLGARLYAGGDRSVAMTVVGVVGDAKYLGLDAADDAVVYEPHWQLSLRSAHVVVRGRGSATESVGVVRDRLAALDPELPLSDVRTMDERTYDSLARPRYWTTLLGLFAGLGLLLAAVGIYGVLSYWVGSQRKELAIRVSLGAAPRSVRWLVVRRGMLLAAVGIGLGVALSLGLSQWLGALLFGVSPHDPTILASVAVGLSAVALLACALPARRATRIEPAAVLKGE